MTNFSLLNIFGTNLLTKNIIPKPTKLKQNRTLFTQPSRKMPLVVPGVTAKSGDKTEEWTNKLTGKKLHDGEDSNETVSSPSAT